MYDFSQGVLGNNKLVPLPLMGVYDGSFYVYNTPHTPPSLKAKSGSIY